MGSAGSNRDTATEEGQVEPCSVGQPWCNPQTASGRDGCTTRAAVTASTDAGDRSIIAVTVARNDGSHQSSWWRTATYSVSTSASSRLTVCAQPILRALWRSVSRGKPLRAITACESSVDPSSPTNTRQSR